MRIWLGVSLALVTGAALAESPDFDACLDRAQGDAAVAQCYFDEDARQTARMDTAFTRLLDAQPSRHDRRLLGEAQSAWIGWRDAQCEWGRALPWGDMPDDLIAPACRMTRTETRADELENLLLFFGSPGPGPDFLLPDSDKRSLTADDLAGLSLSELRIARNEIFARHGRRFSDPQLQAWFEAREWYVPRDGEPRLSAIETANVAFIAAEEARRN